MVVILNKNAGTVGAHGSDHLTTKIRQHFASRGIDAEIEIAAGDASARVAQDAIRRGADVVVAAGGDGTINSVATVLAGSDVALGVLPLGTLNHFARDLKIPLQLGPAIDLIAKGHARSVDVGEVNGHIFLNNSSLGTYPRVVEERDAQQNWFGKRLALILAGLKVVFRRPLVHVRLQFEKRTTVRTTPFLFIGNNVYNLKLFSEELRSNLDGGHLCVFSARCGGVWCLLRLGLRALAGRLQNSREFEQWCVERVSVDTHKRRARVALDGEVVRLDCPLEFRVRRGALKVLASVPA